MMGTTMIPVLYYLQDPRDDQYRILRRPERVARYRQLRDNLDVHRADGRAFQLLKSLGLNLIELRSNDSRQRSASAIKEKGAILLGHRDTPVEASFLWMDADIVCYLADRALSDLSFDHVQVRAWADTLIDACRGLESTSGFRFYLYRHNSGGSSSCIAYVNALSGFKRPDARYAEVYYGDEMFHRLGRKRCFGISQLQFNDPSAIELLVHRSNARYTISSYSSQ